MPWLSVARDVISVTNDTTKKNKKLIWVRISTNYSEIKDTYRSVVPFVMCHWRREFINITSEAIGHGPQTLPFLCLSFGVVRELFNVFQNTLALFGALRRYSGALWRHKGPVHKGPVAA